MNYECHITIAVKDAEKACKLLQAFNWKTSEIKRDPILGDGSHFYFTRHDQSHGKIETHMRLAANTLRYAGIEVLREKIELIVYDTKTGVGL